MKTDWGAFVKSPLWLLLILPLWALYLLLRGPLTYAQTLVVVPTPDHAVVQQGDQINFIVPLYPNGTTFDRAEVHFNFDPAYLAVQLIEPGPRFEHVEVSQFDNNQGTVDYFAASSQSVTTTQPLTLTIIRAHALWPVAETWVHYALTLPRVSQLYLGAQVITDTQVVDSWLTIVGPTPTATELPTATDAPTATALPTATPLPTATVAPTATPTHDELQRADHDTLQEVLRLLAEIRALLTPAR